MQNVLHDKKIFSKYKLHHFIFWLLFGFLWYNQYFYMATDWRSNLLMTMLEMTTFAIVVYFTNYFLIPKFLYMKKFPAFSILFLLTIFICNTVNMVCTWFILKDLMGPKQQLGFWAAPSVVYQYIWMTLIGISGGAVRFFGDQFKFERKIELMQKENAENELKFLKAQINPHFLFNCLNNIYFLINKENHEARNYMVKFSEMLRYQLYECNEEYLSIEKEISYLKNYIETMKLRKGINYHIDFNVQENLTGFKIAPFVLVPFVENAFKHVSNNSSDNNLISINLYKSNGSLNFEVLNTVGHSSKNDVIQSNGIGLKNVTRRLELMYPGRHNIQIDSGKEKYKVKLELKIDHEKN